MTRPAPHVVARIVLAAAALVCGVGMIGPFQGVEEAFVPWDKAAHFLAFYGLTALLFLSFPNRRRVDLAFIAICAGAAVEVLQAMTGRDADIGDIAANAVGAFAVLGPTFIEPLRALSRAPQARPIERRRPGAMAPAGGDPADDEDAAPATSRA
ncbi:VanZ family protein [Phenylobacterium sp.]|uniref:VanZ family protein n=1 Tax=Phenylobacterium sp. TaxID=1871053 RepID=UPI0035B3D3EA